MLTLGTWQLYRKCCFTATPAGAGIGQEPVW